MIRLLGRQTSGNVQKVIFMLEELGLKYVREDYGRQFNNTNTDEYRKINPNMKVPTLIDGDLVSWESNTILRYLAASYRPTMTGATPAENTQVERWILAAGVVEHSLRGSIQGCQKAASRTQRGISGRKARIWSGSLRSSMGI